MACPLLVEVTPATPPPDGGQEQQPLHCIVASTCLTLVVARSLLRCLLLVDPCSCCPPVAVGHAVWQARHESGSSGATSAAEGLDEARWVLVSWCSAVRSWAFPSSPCPPFPLCIPRCPSPGWDALQGQTKQGIIIPCMLQRENTLLSAVCTCPAR
jgi:hypothetical protein